MPSPTLGIIAGSGELPRSVIAEARANGRDVYVIAFEGITDASTVRGVPHTWVHIGLAGRVVGECRERGLVEVVLVGRVGRPAPSSLRLDYTGLRLLASLRRLPSQGDNEVFTAIIHFLEARGLRVVGPENVLQGLLMPEGLLNNVPPDPLAPKDIAIGVKAAVMLGALDIGQAVVVQAGQVLGVEGAEGTDRLVSRCRDLHSEGPGGLLVKVKKPEQDLRVDLPSIGVYTVENAYAAGLRGIAVEAGATLVINREDVVRKADELGIFVIGIDVPDSPLH
jgi:DUF1009 family protein